MTDQQGRDADLRFLGVLDAASSSLNMAAQFAKDNFEEIRFVEYRKIIAQALGEIFDLYVDIGKRHPGLTLWPDRERPFE